jgi:hypothetical protein
LKPMDTSELLLATLQELNGEQVFQVVSSRIFDGKMSLEQGWKFWDHYLAKGKNPADLRSILNRFDWSINRGVNKPGRTKEQAEKSFSEGTAAEGVIFSQFLAGMKAAGHTVQYKNSGIDNTGKLIMESRDTSRADYTISIDGGPWEPMEIKHSPVFSKCTFKVADLKGYVRQKANMLLLLDTGYPEKLSTLPSSRWAFLGPETLASFLELDQGNYKEVGGKQGVQLGSNAKDSSGHRRPLEYSLFFEHHPWGDFSKFTVQRRILTKRKNK